MTIVLQHQYWDLDIAQDEFSVGLAFGGIRNFLTVPFGSVTSFADPSVNFALQFESEKAPAPVAIEPAAETETDDSGDSVGDDAEKVVTLDAFREK